MNYKYFRCSELIDVRDGTHDSPKYQMEGYPLITSKNIKNNNIIFDDVNLISEDDYKKINERSKVDKGDILMPMIGTIGNPVIVDVDPNFAVKNVALFKFKDNQQVYNRYFYYLLKSNIILQQLSSLKRGGTQSFVSLKNIRELKIPVPSYEQQIKVANILDKAQELIDKRKAQIEALDELIQSVFYDMFGTMNIKDTKWDIVKLEDISNYFIGLTYKPEDVKNKGVVVLRSTNIQNNVLDLTDMLRVDKKINDRLLVENGDILMCSRNGSARLVGKVAKIPKLDEPMTFGAFMTIIRSNYNTYLLNYFRTTAFRNQIMSGATSTINQITKKMLDDIVLPLPPIELQNQFAEIVENIEKQKVLLNESLVELENNFNSLMQRAFNGGSLR